MKQLLNLHNEYMSFLPKWGQDFTEKYLSGTTNLYFIYGNIRDYLPHGNDQKFVFVRVSDYISEVFFGNNGIIIFYDRSQGVKFCHNDDRKEYLEIMHELNPQVEIEDFESPDPMLSFAYLEQFFLYKKRSKDKRRIALIIDYAETIIPANDIGDLDEVDRFCFVTCNRWAHLPWFTDFDISIIMLTENIADINSRLASSPSTIKIQVPLPDEKTRTLFLRFMQSQGIEKLELLIERGVSVDSLGKLSAGLNLFNLYQLAAEAYQKEIPISLDYLAQKKREIIEREASGLLEFVETQHDLSFVSGHEFVKKRFELAAKALKRGRVEVMPMGYLICGPIGTGKSFMVSAFANEIGIPMVKLGNIHSQNRGFTESGLEKILSILKAMQPVAVMIDEADVLLGGKRETKMDSNSAGTFSRLIEFMGDTDYRGKIIWFLITCRPDLLPIDIKRQGRAEEHLAIFYPSTSAERVALFETLSKKLDIRLSSDIDFKKVIPKIKFAVSGADIESILVRARMNATADTNERKTVKMTDIEKTIEDFIPPNYPYEIELQNLVAMLECTSKEMIPKEYQNIDRGNLLKQLIELKQLIGEQL